MKHVVAISGGKDSVAMALRLAEVEPHDYDYLITPTGNELPEMQEHWERLEVLLGKPLTRLQPFPGDGLLHLIREQNALPNFRQRWCTRILKIEPTIKWLTDHAPCIQYVGLRADEDERTGIYGDIPGVAQRYPLREWGWGIEDVWRYLAERGVKIPERTDCALCYGQRLIEWKRLSERNPDHYKQGEDMEAMTGHTFRSAKRDSWPASLVELRREFESGRKVRGDVAVTSERQLELWQDDCDFRDMCRVCRM